MKSLLLLLVPLTAHASWFDFEAGLGVSYTKDMGDGVWYQQALPHAERVTTPAITLGLTGKVYDSARYDVRWHADYVYLGTYSASCECVPDANYNAQTHQTVGDLPRLSPFNGQGHTQGVALTLEPGYTYHGIRYAVEAGPFVFWQTWHESLYDLGGHWDDLSHKTVAQLGYVVGASVSRGPWSLSYRYYAQPQKWNPYPGLATGAHTLTVKYRW